MSNSKIKQSKTRWYGKVQNYSKINPNGSVYLKNVLFSKKQNEVVSSMISVTFLIAIAIGILIGYLIF